MIFASIGGSFRGTPSEISGCFNDASDLFCHFFMFSPRELDFLNLLEALELEEAAAPIDITHRHREDTSVTAAACDTDGDEDEVLPSVSVLRRLFHSVLPQWRTEVLAALEEDALQNLEFVAAPSNLSRLAARLEPLVQKLRDQFPGWCESSLETRTVELVSGEYGVWEKLPASQSNLAMQLL